MDNGNKKGGISLFPSPQLLLFLSLFPPPPLSSLGSHGPSSSHLLCTVAVFEPAQPAVFPSRIRVAFFPPFSSLSPSLPFSFARQDKIEYPYPFLLLFPSFSPPTAEGQAAGCVLSFPFPPTRRRRDRRNSCAARVSFFSSSFSIDFRGVEQLPSGRLLGLFFSPFSSPLSPTPLSVGDRPPRPAVVFFPPSSFPSPFLSFLSCSPRVSWRSNPPSPGRFCVGQRRLLGRKVCLYFSSFPFLSPFPSLSFSLSPLVKWEF